MGKETAIAWTDHTFNIAWGCTEVTRGCDNCYAREFARKQGYNGTGDKPELWGIDAARRTFSDKHWKQPHDWNRLAERNGQSRRVFCSSMADIGDPHPTIVAQLPRLWQTIRETPWLDWQLLTKRPGRYQHILPPDWGDGWPNVWLGTTIEEKANAGRAMQLVHNKAAVYWISWEPALDDITTSQTLIDWLRSPGKPIWIIYGGESGNGTKNYRPEDKQWARNGEELCEREDWTFFHKQSAGVRTETGIELDGRIVRNYPIERRTSPAVLPPARPTVPLGAMGSLF